MRSGILIVLFTLCSGASGQTMTHGFEQGLSPWVADDYIGATTLPWVFVVRRSQAQAHDGEWSVEVSIDGRNDDGTVWLERAVSLGAGTYDVTLSFWLWSESVAQIGVWEVLGYVGEGDPEVELDFTGLGPANQTQGWHRYEHTQSIALTGGSQVWVAAAINVVFETLWRTHYIDSMTIEIVGQGCRADCDQSSGPGVLDIFDFLCFQNSFVNGEPYACECDTTTGPFVCDIFDFLCFQNAFVAGCR